MAPVVGRAGDRHRAVRRARGSVPRERLPAAGAASFTDAPRLAQVLPCTIRLIHTVGRGGREREGGFPAGQRAPKRTTREGGGSRYSKKAFKLFKGGQKLKPDLNFPNMVLEQPSVLSV